METKENWDDLVFENRNKEYGAYVMRKSYSKNVSEGALISFGIAALVLIAPTILSGVFGTKKIADVKPKGDIIFTARPLIEPISKPRVTGTPKRILSASLVPVAVADEPEIEQPVLQNVETPSQAGTDLGTDILPIEGTGLAEVVAPVVTAPPATVDWAEKMPEYQGGRRAMAQFVARNMKYPHSAKTMGTEGLVFVQFVVDQDGHVTDVKIVKGISADCDKEAARVIGDFPDWIPGKQGQNAVSVRMVLPIKFKIEN